MTKILMRISLKWIRSKIKPETGDEQCRSVEDKEGTNTAIYIYNPFKTHTNLILSFSFVFHSNLLTENGQEGFMFTNIKLAALCQYTHQRCVQQNWPLHESFPDHGSILPIEIKAEYRLDSVDLLINHKQSWRLQRRNEETVWGWFCRGQCVAWKMAPSCIYLWPRHLECVIVWCIDKYLFMCDVTLGESEEWKTGLHWDNRRHGGGGTREGKVGRYWTLWHIMTMGEHMFQKWLAVHETEYRGHT